ncbi:MAG: alpha-amylase family protein, partial [Cyanobacteria bacterium J06641_5]
MPLFTTRNASLRHRARQSSVVSSFLALTVLGAIASLTPLLHFDRRVSAAAAQPQQNPDTFVHLFEWRWEDIARECEEFLGPKGFTAVQVSPPHEHAIVAGNPWWSRYQVVSYQIASRSGDRREFADMVRRCQAAGVGIYVDAIVNHTTGVGTGVGFLGTPFGEYDYPAIPYSFDDFHHCGRHGDDDIRNYQDRFEVQNCELVELADLDTGSETVRDRLGAYLNDLLSLGVAGFRIDASKHMSVEDITAILSRLDREAVIYQEVIQTTGEPIRAAEYLGNGRVTEFRYGRDVSAAFLAGSLSELRELGNVGEWLPSERAIVFIDNHDNQRGHGAGGNILSHKKGKLYELAVLFMLAHPYGRPRVMSSFDFDNTEQGPPIVASGATRPVHTETTLNCFRNDWKCEHRWPAIANMAAFRQAVGDAPLENWWDNGSDQIAFSRGDRGFLALNRATDRFLDRVLQTGLPAGNYCNVARDNFDVASN